MLKNEKYSGVEYTFFFKPFGKKGIGFVLIVDLYVYFNGS